MFARATTVVLGAGSVTLAGALLLPGLALASETTGAEPDPLPVVVPIVNPVVDDTVIEAQLLDIARSLPPMLVEAPDTSGRTTVTDAPSLVTRVVTEVVMPKASRVSGVDASAPSLVTTVSTVTKAPAAATTVVSAPEALPVAAPVAVRVTAPVAAPVTAPAVTPKVAAKPIPSLVDLGSLTSGDGIDVKLAPLVKAGDSSFVEDNRGALLTGLGILSALSAAYLIAAARTRGSVTPIHL